MNRLLITVLPFTETQVSCSPLNGIFMEYSNIVSVTGLPGLHELVSTKTDGAVVRSLADNTSRFVSNRIHRFSHLESIEVFTSGDNVNLVEIFNVMEKSDDPLPDDKNEDAVKKYFLKVYPDMDFEKVYKSDMKKIIKWFEELKKNNIEIKLSEPIEEPTVEEPVDEKPETTEKDIAGTKKEKKAIKKPAKKKKE